MKIKLSATNLMKFCIGFFVIFQTYIQNKIVSIPGLLPLLSGVIIILFLLCYMPRFALRSGNKLPSECSFFFAYAVLMLFVGLLSSNNISSHISRTMDVFAYSFLLFATVYVCKAESSPDFVLWLMYITAIILSLSFIRNPVLLSSGRYSLTYEVNPNALGMSMMLGIWCLICLKRERRINLLFTILSAVLFIYCMFLSASLKSIAAMIVFIVVDYFFSFRKGYEARRGKTKRVFIDLFVIILLALAIVVFFIREDSFYNTIVGGRVFEILQGTASMKRLKLYEYGTELIRKNLFFGVGFNGFEDLYGTYSHSTIIEVLASGGLFGGGFYLIGFVCIFVSYVKKYVRFTKKSSNSYYMVGEAVAGMALMTVLLFVIIHPYELISYLSFAVCICLCNCSLSLTNEFEG